MRHTSGFGSRSVSGSRRGRWWWLAILLPAFVAAAGCGRPPARLAPTKPTEVVVSLPVTKEITDYEEFTGQTDAVVSVNVRARVTGYLDKVNFADGAEVKEGAVLFEIDPRTYDADLARADANLLQAEAHLNRLTLDYQRAVRLRPTGAIGQDEFDKTAGDRAEAEAAVKVARAARDISKLNVGFTKVTASVTGRISRRLVDPGNLVKADDTILTTIVTLDPMYAYFDVDERTVLRIRRLIEEQKVQSARGREVSVQIGLSDEQGLFPHTGTVNFIDNKVDPSTGTLRLRGVLPNPVVRGDTSSPNGVHLLSPGQFVRVRLPIGTPQSRLLISERALGSDQGQRFVYVVNDENEVLPRRYVKIGSLHDGLRVIDEGLAPGERVIVSGLQSVRAGAKVNPKLAETSPTAEGPAKPAVVIKKE